MDLSRPHRILQSGVDAEVLRVLAGSRSAMSGRQVARLSRDGSPETVLRSLRRLSRLGVLDVTEAGRALMYSFNREHLAAPAIEILVSLRQRIIDALVAEVSGLDPPPLGATLFGSTARGDGGIDSDIDLLIVHSALSSRDAWDDQVDALSGRVRRMTGNPVSVHDIGREDLSRLARERPPIVEEIERDVVPLYGEPIDALLSRAVR